MQAWWRSVVQKFHSSSSPSKPTSSPPIQADPPLRKWMIFGAQGWIGAMTKDLLVYQGEYVHVARSRADDVPAVTAEIEAVKPTHVVSWIGRTHGEGIPTIDYLEQPGKLVENMRDNLFGIMVLANLSKTHNFHLTSGGTGCIFEYDEGHPQPFKEDDEPNFFGSSYSIVKGITDRLLHMYNDTVLNVRIRMPITDAVHPRNFITKIASYPKVHSVSNSMSVLPDLIPHMINLARKKTTGTINLTNPGTISHEEILKMYTEIVDPTHTWESVPTVDGLVVAKRSNNALDTTRLTSLCPTVQPIHDAVRQCLKNMAMAVKSNPLHLSHSTPLPHPPPASPEPEPATETEALE